MSNVLLARDTGQWTEYAPESSADYIPIEQWGRDHWSTFAYCESRVVNYAGKLHNPHMRCTPRVHREFMHRGSTGNYPTVLAGNVKLEKHDDWSCLEDMCAAGLLRAWFNTLGCTFGGGKAKIELTADGHHYIAKLRRHKESDGKWGNFRHTD